MIVHEGPVDPSTVRKWGYDENFLLLDQDEDLLLGDPQFYPVLAELAGDPKCPKGEYAVTIVDYSLMFRVLRKDPAARRLITDALALFSTTNNRLTRDFLTVNRVRLQLLDRPLGLDEERVLEIGRAALNGVARDAHISCCELSECWRIQLSVPPFHRHREWLTIDKRTGDFSHDWRGDCGQEYAD